MAWPRSAFEARRGRFVVAVFASCDFQGDARVVVAFLPQWCCFGAGLQWGVRGSAPSSTRLFAQRSLHIARVRTAARPTGTQKERSAQPLLTNRHAHELRCFGPNQLSTYESTYELRANMFLVFGKHNEDMCSKS